DVGVPEALVEYEHRIARIGATVQRRGMRLDVAYTHRLSDELEREAQHFENVAKTYGVNSVNSPKQVAEALSAMGETLTEKTASGALAVGKEVLLPLADLNTQWQRLGTREPNKLADGCCVQNALANGEPAIPKPCFRVGTSTITCTRQSTPWEHVPRVGRCPIPRYSNCHPRTAVFAAVSTPLPGTPLLLPTLRRWNCGCWPRWPGLKT